MFLTKIMILEFLIRNKAFNHTKTETHKIYYILATIFFYGYEKDRWEKIPTQDIISIMTKNIL